MYSRTYAWEVTAREKTACFLLFVVVHTPVTQRMAAHVLNAA
jgi:hypothetical protein